MGDQRYLTWITEWPSTHVDAGQSVEVIPRAEYDALRTAMRETLDIMGQATDRELGEGGVARRAYGHLHTALYAYPANTRMTERVSDPALPDADGVAAADEHRQPHPG